MHNKCLRCGSEEHLVKSCNRATKRKEARAAQADETPDEPEADEPEQDEDEPDAAQDDTEDEEDQNADEEELDPDIDDYELVDPDDFSVETVDANAMNKGKGRGRGQGQQGSGNRGGKGRRWSSRGHELQASHRRNPRAAQENRLDLLVQVP
eukprot:4260013-Amphidinium_carterae.2